MSNISSQPSPRWVDLVADAWSEIIDRIDVLDAQKRLDNIQINV
jgi:hypothetical protein